MGWSRPVCGPTGALKLYTEEEYQHIQREKSIRKLLGQF